MSFVLVVLRLMLFITPAILYRVLSLEFDLYFFLILFISLLIKFLSSDLYSFIGWPER